MNSIVIGWNTNNQTVKKLQKCIEPSEIENIYSPSYTVTIQAPIHHDSSRFETDGKIGMRRDGKKEIPASILCLTMLQRCQHDSSTDPLRLMTAALLFTTVELRMLTNTQDASTIRYGARTIQAGSVTVASRPPTNLHDLVVVIRQSKGGGVLSFFSSYVGSGPASTVRPPPPKKKKFQEPPKIFEILAPPPQKKKIPSILYLDLKKRPQNA